MNYYSALLRPLLFRLSPELAHRLALRFAGVLSPFVPRRIHTTDSLRVQVQGLDFGNPLGLAAGWDKSCEAPKLLSRLAWGHFEIGSVSALPSVGNPKPRLRRLVKDAGVIVNYGLPNAGASVVSERLRKYRAGWARDPAETRPLVGVNLVKTNDRHQAAKSSFDVIEDYAFSMQKFAGLADYVTLNLSCPNAADEVHFFDDFRNVERLLREIAGSVTCPLFLKITPTQNQKQLEELLAAVSPFDFVKGFQFNLAIGQPEWLELKDSGQQVKSMPGAVAGQPICEFQQVCVERFASLLPPKRFILISAGGIHCAETAYRRICGGASLIQIYTALVYHGPQLVLEILEGLEEKLHQDGFNSVSEAIGSSLT